MNESPHELVIRLHREEWERIQREGVPPPVLPPRPTIHWSDLPEDRSGKPTAAAWNFYRREAGRLLAEGHEGKWVLLNKDQVVGIWDTQEEAYKALLSLRPCDGLLIRQILEREPILRAMTVYR